MAKENLGILTAIQSCGRLTVAEVTEVIDTLNTVQTGAFDMTDEDFRDAVEEALEDEG